MLKDLVMSRSLDLTGVLWVCPFCVGQFTQGIAIIYDSINDR